MQRIRCRQAFQPTDSPTLLLPLSSHSSKLTSFPSPGKLRPGVAPSCPTMLGRSIMKRACLTIAVLLLLGSGAFVRADWQPAKGPLMTRWAKDVTPERVHPEYPRP